MRDTPSDGDDWSALEDPLTYRSTLLTIIVDMSFGLRSETIVTSLPQTGEDTGISNLSPQSLHCSFSQFAICHHVVSRRRTGQRRNMEAEMEIKLLEIRSMYGREEHNGSTFPQVIGRLVLISVQDMN